MMNVESTLASFDTTEATQAEPNQVAAEVTEESDAPEENQETEETSTSEDAEVISKKALNRISRQDKRIGKLTWEKHAKDQTIADLQAQLAKHQPQSRESAEPQEKDYSGRFDQYVFDRAKYEASQEAKSFFEQQTKQQAQVSDQQKQIEQIHQQVAVAEKAAEKFIAEVPDAKVIQQEFEEYQFPQHVSLALLGLGDKLPQAIYQLGKADKFDELENASPMQAQILIASALATPFTRPVSKAPAPVRSAKGNPTTGNSLPTNPDELLKHIRKG